jgi:hypothetical protein
MRKKFTPSEDALLMCLVAQFGRFGWDVIAGKMQNRNTRQCRERWKHYLSVGFEDRPWTKAEDELLIEKEKQIGQRWTKLAAFFHNRSDIQIKARWCKLLEKKNEKKDAEITIMPPAKHDEPVLVFELGGADESGIDLETGLPTCDTQNWTRTNDMMWF